MKIKTSDLIGRPLDWAVAIAMDGTDLRFDMVETRWVKIDGKDRVLFNGWSPSTDWAQGGPIIEREKISPAYEPSLIYDDSCRWKAVCAISDAEKQYGPTPLVAALRCYVASKLGDEVEVPFC